MADSYPLALGKAIRVRRSLLDIKRRELSEMAELSYPYVSEIENGLKRPSMEALQRLAHALDMEVSELTAAAEDIQEDVDLVSPGSPTQSDSRSQALRRRAQERPDDSAFALSLRRVEDPALSTGNDGPVEARVRAIVSERLDRWAYEELPSIVRREVARALAERDELDGR